MFENYGKTLVPSNSHEAKWAFKDFYTIHSCTHFELLLEYSNLRLNTTAKYCVDCGKIHIDSDIFNYKIPKLFINRKHQLGFVKWDWNEFGEWFEFQELPYHPNERDPIKREIQEAIFTDSIKQSIENVTVQHFGYWYNSQYDASMKQIFIRFRMQKKDYEYRWTAFNFEESYFDTVQEFFKHINVENPPNHILNHQLSLALIIRELCIKANDDLKAAVMSMNR